MIKLVAFDLDGTVVDHENVPTRSTLETIERLIDQGIHVASISGRSISNSQRPFEQNTDFADTLSVGSYNGALALDRVRDGNRRLLHEQRMPEDMFREIIRYVDTEGINYIYCNLKFDDGRVEIEDYTPLREDKTIQDMVVQTGSEFVIDPDLTRKIDSGFYGIPPKVLICPGEDRREAVYADLKSRFNDRLYIERTDVDRVEAMHPTVNKAKALAAICEASEVAIEEAMAIGDGSNDLPMLEAAGVGALLGNADDTTKAAARNVEHLPSFHDNGFTVAVERFVFDA
jgi:Cof subfamily protein (haloacid dehalogenase superfamily)